MKKGGAHPLTGILPADRLKCEKSLQRQGFRPTPYGRMDLPTHAETIAWFRQEKRIFTGVSRTAST